jgi:hypothetical protein
VPSTRAATWQQDDGNIFGYRCGATDEALSREDRLRGIDFLREPAVDFDCVPPTRSITSDDLSGQEFEGGALAVIKGRTQTFVFTFKVTGQLARGAQFAVLRGQRGILFFELVERFEAFL